MTEKQRIIDYLVAGNESHRQFYETAVDEVLNAQKAVIKADLSEAIAARDAANG